MGRVVCEEDRAVASRVLGGAHLLAEQRALAHIGHEQSAGGGSGVAGGAQEGGDGALACLAVEQPVG